MLSYEVGFRDVWNAVAFPASLEMESMNIGVVDCSAGNGHMFSFSALFNGYKESELEKCPFPAIAGYLPKYETPVPALSKIGRVTDIWMPELQYANQIARFATIQNVHEEVSSLIERVDAILLTNDEPLGRENVLDLCIKSGKPVFIDKLIAKTKSEFLRVIRSQQYDGQIFCGSGAGFAEDFAVLNWHGSVEIGVFSAPKNWENYGIHVVDIFLKFAERENLVFEIRELIREGDVTKRIIEILGENQQKIIITTLGKIDSDISVTLLSGKDEKSQTMKDPFHSFSTMLEHWLKRDTQNTYQKELSRYKSALSILGFDKE
jgi:hypothetical protein